MQSKAPLPPNMDHQAIVPSQLSFFSTTCMVIRPRLPNVVALNLPGALTAIIFSIATVQRLLYTISLMAPRFPLMQKLGAFPTGRLIASPSSSMDYIHLYSSRLKISSNSYCYMTPIRHQFQHRKLHLSWMLTLCSNLLPIVCGRLMVAIFSFRRASGYSGRENPSFPAGDSIW